MIGVSASEEIPRISSNQEVHYRIHKSPSQGPILEESGKLHHDKYPQIFCDIKQPLIYL
jgi:hypothetical protein